MQIGAAYIRVSTDDQVEFSPDSQLKAIIKYAKANDIILNDEFIFIDDGISGRTAKKRPEFNRMIGIAKTKPKPFDVILLWKFSRFARNREDSIVYKSLLRKQLGIEVISISENTGDDKTSILFEAIIEAMDEYYSINLSEEVKRGMTEKALRGQVQTSPPFGYFMENKQFFINEEESQIISMIFNDYISGSNLNTIAKKINSLGIKTHRGNKFERRTIEYIVRNPIYIGKVRWTPTGKIRRNFKNPDSIITDGTHKPIVSEEIWNKANELLDRQKQIYQKYYKPPKNPSPWLVGLVRCKECGHAIVKSGDYYQCKGYSSGMCFSHYISISSLEQAVIENLEHCVKTNLKGISVQTIKKGRTVYSEEYLSSSLSKAKAKLSRIKEAYQSGIDSLDEYRINKQTVEKEIEEIKSKFAAAEPTNQNEIREGLKKSMALALEAIHSQTATNTERSSLLKSFIKKIDFSKPSNSLEFHYYHAV